MPAGGNLKIPGKRILVTGSVGNELEAICRLLEREGYCCMGIPTLQQLEKTLQELAALAVLLDLDTIAVTNRVVRDLTANHPGLCFLGISASRLHPELKDAIAYHIFACLAKPVDPDELLYWLKCIRDNEADSRGPPDG